MDIFLKKDYMQYTESFKESLSSLTSNIDSIKKSLQENLKSVKDDFQDFQSSGNRQLEEKIRQYFNDYGHFVFNFSHF